MTILQLAAIILAWIQFLGVGAVMGFAVWVFVGMIRDNFQVGNNAFEYGWSILSAFLIALIMGSILYRIMPFEISFAVVS